MNLDQLKQEIRKRTLAFRSIDRTVQSLKFVEAWELSANPEVVVPAILAGDNDAVLSWINKTIKESLDVGELSLRDLRKKASLMGIPRYHLLSKDRLLQEIAQTKEIADVSSTGLQNRTLGVSADELAAALARGSAILERELPAPAGN